MFQLRFNSPVASPTSIKVVGDGPETERSAREEEKAAIIRNALAEWAADETGSPFWAVGPSGKHYEPPTWAQEYGFEFYDPYPEYGHSHYFHVRAI